MSGEDRADGLDLAEHRRGEDVEPRAVGEEAAPRCRGGPCERLAPSAASQSPPPQSQAAFGERRVGRERGANGVEVAVGVADELLGGCS